MNLSPNVYKTVGLVLTLLVLAIETLGKHVGIGDELRSGLVTFLTGAAVLIRDKKDDGGAGMTTRIVGGLAAVAFALSCLSCTPAELQKAQAKALPVLTKLQAAAVQVDQALAFAEKHGVTPEAIASARDAWKRGDHGEALVLAHGALKMAAELGADVPRELVAGLELVIRLAEVQAIEGFSRAMKPTSRLKPLLPPRLELPPYDPRRRLARRSFLEAA